MRLVQRGSVSLYMVPARRAAVPGKHPAACRDAGIESPSEKPRVRAELGECQAQIGIAGQAVMRFGYGAVQGRQLLRAPTGNGFRFRGGIEEAQRRLVAFAQGKQVAHRHAEQGEKA